MGGGASGRISSQVRMSGTEDARLDIHIAVHGIGHWIAHSELGSRRLGHWREGSGAVEYACRTMRSLDCHGLHMVEECARRKSSMRCYFQQPSRSCQVKEVRMVE